MRRRVFALLPGAWLLVACAGQPQPPPQPIYSVWLHDDYYWYDDDFWIWIDDNPDCCSNPDDLRDALKRWWEGLPPDQQDKVRQRVADWLEEHGLQPENVTEVRELVLETVQDRWDALTPEERRAWLDGRSDRAKARLAQRSGVDPLTLDQDRLRARAQGWRADLTPEQRAELARQYSAQRTFANHPTPSGYPSAGRVGFSDRAGRGGGGFGGGGGLGGGGAGGGGGGGGGGGRGR